ncbi:MAG: asparagine synthetase B family protein [Alphaproteobacteria bacterium]
MDGVCGWIGTASAASSPDETLAAMAAGLTAPPTAVRGASAEPGAGLAAVGAAGHTDFRCAAGIRAAVVGDAEWRDTELAAIAARDGDAAALIAAYRRHGKDLLSRLGGTAAVAVIDGPRERALIALDRLGIQTLCYATPTGGGLVFGTLTDCVRAHPKIGSRLDPQALFDYLYFTRCPAPGTIYADQRKLLPAEYVWFAKGGAETGRYWHVPYDDSKPEGGVPALAAELRGTMRDAVRRAAGNEETDQIGCFLSGGIDSSTITGLLGEVRAAPPKAFTIGFDVSDFNEADFARAAARHFGARLSEYFVTPDDVVDLVPRLAGIYDEPFGNASAVAVYYCARLAAEHGVRRLLAGDGGDEVFAGNKRYATQRIFALYDHLPEWLRAGVIEPVAFGIPGGKAIYPVRKARRYIEQARLPMPERMESANFYNDLDLAGCFAPEIAAGIDRAHPIAVMRGAYDGARTDSMLNRMLNLDMQITLADDDLRKVSRMCALAGVEVRYPFLDEAVVELAARVPPAAKLRGTHLRAFFRDTFRDFLPPSTLKKSKHGFGLPFGVWLRTHPALQELAYDSIAALKGRDIFAPAFLDEAVALHRGGHTAYYGEIVWVLMILELWLRSRQEGARQAWTWTRAGTTMPPGIR